MAEPRSIRELTEEELRQIIRETVQESMAEVLMEFAMAADIDREILQQAEMADYLRIALAKGADRATDFVQHPETDD
jgi:ferredoxin-fold anticodon binding domain-containing protein